MAKNINKVSTFSELDQKRSNILKISHAIAIAIIVPSVVAIISPFIFEGNKLAEISSNFGLAFLSAILVYKFIELWVDNEYRELRIKEYRSTLLHQDSITEILKEGAVENILEACLKILFRDKNVAFGIRQLLKRYSDETPLSKDNYRESVTLSEHDNKYYKLKRVVSFNKSNLPSTLTFRCKFSENEEQGRTVILDRTREDSWYFLNHPSDNALPQNAFIISSLKINNKRIETISTKNRLSDHEIEYFFRIPDKFAGKNERVRIKYEMEVLQSRTGGFYSTTSIGSTKNIHLNFNSELDHKLHVITQGLSCIYEPDLIENDKNIEVSIEDWVFPNSTIVFSWSEYQEKSS
jgi:hypothetical protein